MSRFSKLSHVVWHCQYHIVWVPKYRHRILTDKIGFEVSKTIRIYAERLGCELVELNVQPRSCTFTCKDTTKDFGIKTNGNSKRKNSIAGV